MKRIISIILVVFIMLSLCTAAFADDQQESFLKDMADGLIERWNIADQENLTPEEEMDSYYRLVNLELDRIEKYQSVSFQNKKFDLLAKAYIEGCQLQRNALKYYRDRQNLFALQWSTGYQQRTICIVGIYDYYGLEITDEMIELFRSDFESLNDESNNSSAPMSYQVNAKDCFINVISQEFDNRDPSSGSIFDARDIRITVKNITPIALSNLIIYIDLLDENNNIVDTKMGISSSLVQPNQSITISGFILTDIPYAIKVSKYYCKDEEGNSYTGYVPDAPMLTIVEG